MTLRRLLIIVAAIAILGILSLPVAAQDGSTTMPVTGTFNYTPEIQVWEEVNTSAFAQTTEAEEWSGDISGMAFGEARIIILPSGAWDAWIQTSFDEAQIGDKIGSMVILFHWYRPAPTAQWYAEWMILRGTDELENAHGWGEAWGPGFNPEDPEASPDIFYSGQIIFLEPMGE